MLCREVLVKSNHYGNLKKNLLMDLVHMVPNPWGGGGGCTVDQGSCAEYLLLFFTVPILACIMKRGGNMNGGLS